MNPLIRTVEEFEEARFISRLRGVPVAITVFDLYHLIKNYVRIDHNFYDKVVVYEARKRAWQPGGTFKFVNNNPQIHDLLIDNAVLVDTAGSLTGSVQWGHESVVRFHITPETVKTSLKSQHKNLYVPQYVPSITKKQYAEYYRTFFDEICAGL